MTTQPWMQIMSTLVCFGPSQPKFQRARLLSQPCAARHQSQAQVPMGFRDQLQLSVSGVFWPQFHRELYLMVGRPFIYWDYFSGICCEIFHEIDGIIELGSKQRQRLRVHIGRMFLFDFEGILVSCLLPGGLNLFSCAVEDISRLIVSKQLGSPVSQRQHCLLSVSTTQRG